MLDIITELSKFNHIKYYDEPHLYYINNKEMVSATTFIGKFSEKFDNEKEAKKFADKNGLNYSDVLNEWAHKRDFSTTKGSAVHDYAENYLNNKIFPYDPTPAIKRFGSDIIKPNYEKCVEIFLKFYEDSKKNLIPIKSEFVIGDEELGICGMIDQLYYNKKTNQLQIWDWKTNKKIDTSNNFKKTFKAPIEHLPYCEYYKYSLQLNLYKFILEKNTNLGIGNLYFVWIFEGNSTYKIFECVDLQREIKELFNKS